jgi:hypothetical protein
MAIHSAAPVARDSTDAHRSGKRSTMFQGISSNVNIQDFQTKKSIVEPEI